MRIPESELIINPDGSAFHIHIRPSDLADTVILVGDPGRVEIFRRRFTSVRAEGASREFVWTTGTFNGKEFTVLSTGIGPDNIDIVMTELDALANVDFETREEKPVHRSLRIVRVGTSGAIRPDIPIGSFVFSEISVGFDGVMNWYEGREKFALPEIEAAFLSHIDWNPYLPKPYFVRNSETLGKLFASCTVPGMTISAPGFYGPQGRVVRQGLAMPDMLEKLESFSFEGHTFSNFEMEGAVIAGMGRKLGHETATLCCIIANRHNKDANTGYKSMVEDLANLVLEKLTL
ncbi:MAG: nucleoside phosphorylase [Bacteroidales bacterium]|nr:nucleoside phosphorylase [Bacteroidales bacterium]